jgi:hypothetical protein
VDRGPGPDGKPFRSRRHVNAEALEMRGSTVRPNLGANSISFSSRKRWACRLRRREMVGDWIPVSAINSAGALVTVDPRPAHRPVHCGVRHCLQAATPSVESSLARAECLPRIVAPPSGGVVLGVDGVHRLQGFPYGDRCHPENFAGGSERFGEGSARAGKAADQTQVLGAPSCQGSTGQQQFARDVER